MVFVTVVDTGTYIADPSTEKVLSDLFVDLGFDLSIGAVSTIVGAIAAGVGMALLGIMGAPAVIFLTEQKNKTK